mgnify:CR=1 FL=1
MQRLFNENLRYISQERFRDCVMRPDANGLENVVQSNNLRFYSVGCSSVCASVAVDFLFLDRDSNIMSKKLCCVFSSSPA